MSCLFDCCALAFPAQVQQEPRNLEIAVKGLIFIIFVSTPRARYAGSALKNEGPVDGLWNDVFIG